MDMAEKYPASLVLTEITQNLEHHHSELSVSLPTGDLAHQQGLSANQSINQSINQNSINPVEPIY